MQVYSSDDRRLCRSSSTIPVSSIVRLPDTTPSLSPPLPQVIILEALQSAGFSENITLLILKKRRRLQ